MLERDHEEIDRSFLLTSCALTSRIELAIAKKYCKNHGGAKKRCPREQEEKRS